MIALTADAMRALEQRAMTELAVTSLELMDRAGLVAAETALQMAEDAGYHRPNQPIHLFAGRGNNGGDVFAAARHLKTWNHDVDVWLAGDLRSLTGDAAAHAGKLKTLGVSIRELPTRDDWDVAIRDYRWDGTILVDGILGIGARGPARGPADGAIRFINALATWNRVLSIDIPSGLDPDTGDTPGNVVVADTTLTLGCPKVGLLQPRALAWVGNLFVGDIGLPHAAPLTSDMPPLELITAQDLRPLFPRRQRIAHKGDFGHVLVVGGARGFTGAAGLAALGALRSGAGLVTVLTPSSVAPLTASLAPEAMVRFAPETPQGTLAASAIRDCCPDLESFNSILVGPGLSRQADSLELCREIFRRAPGTIVVDADALAILAGLSSAEHPPGARTILTPHPGELGRLIGSDATSVQQDRFAALTAALERYVATVVLKGAGTLVGAKGLGTRVNLTGNPGMASAGMGDILAGLVAGFSAQGLTPVNAASAAVYVHGRAGDLASWETSQASLIATDLLDHIPTALLDITPR